MCGRRQRRYQINQHGIAKTNKTCEEQKNAQGGRFSGVKITSSVHANAQGQVAFCPDEWYKRSLTIEE
jgi:hypothetical protein